jgi:hypothetical protein
MATPRKKLFNYELKYLPMVRKISRYREKLRQVLKKMA